jgi:hypothetical protein
MDPYREEPCHEEPKAAKPPSEKKQKRFRIVKLEERVAPRHRSLSAGKVGAGSDCTGTLSIE